MGVFNVNVFLMEWAAWPLSCPKAGYCLNRDADPLDLTTPGPRESCVLGDKEVCLQSTSSV